jgi:hypothetical protein
MFNINIAHFKYIWLIQIKGKKLFQKTLSVRFYSKASPNGTFDSTVP